MDMICSVKCELFCFPEEEYYAVSVYVSGNP